MRIPTIAFLLVGLAACGGSTGPAGEIIAEFLLADVNATSVTYNTNVSPRDLQGGASAWYFGAAT